MSRIEIRGHDFDVDIRGSERAYMAGVITNIALALIDPRLNKDKIKAVLPDDCYLLGYSGSDFVKSFGVWFSVGDETLKNGDDLFSIKLNTVYRFGNDQIKLMARLHGQCEIHCYMTAGCNARWLAGIIRDGLESGLYRRNQGWEELESSLDRYNGNSHIVCSYSVSDGFPSYSVADFDGEQEDFYELPLAEQWSRSMAGLTRNKGLELKPDNFQDYYFGNGHTVFDLLETSGNRNGISVLK